MKKLALFLFLLTLAASFFSGCMSNASADFSTDGLAVGTQTQFVTTNFTIEGEEVVLAAVEEVVTFTNCEVAKKEVTVPSIDTRNDGMVTEVKWTCSCNNKVKSYAFSGATPQNPEGIYAIGSEPEIRLPISAVTPEGSVVLPAVVTKRNFWEKRAKHQPANVDDFSTNVLQIMTE